MSGTVEGKPLKQMLCCQRVYFGMSKWAVVLFYLCCV